RRRKHNPVESVAGQRIEPLDWPFTAAGFFDVPAGQNNRIGPSPRVVMQPPVRIIANKLVQVEPPAQHGAEIVSLQIRPLAVVDKSRRQAVRDPVKDFSDHWRRTSLWPFSA